MSDTNAFVLRHLNSNCVLKKTKLSNNGFECSKFSLRSLSYHRMAEVEEPLATNEPVAIMPSTSKSRFSSINSDAMQFEQPIFEHHADTFEHIDASASSSMPSSQPNNSKSQKSGRDIIAFENGNAKDPWNDNHEIDSVINPDYAPPCPFCARHAPYCCIAICCCCWSDYDRQHCALALLYTKFYLSVYFLSMIITVGLLVYDLSNGSIANSELDREPIWFISLDIFCVLLMVFDISIQIQSSGYKKYFKSCFSIFDFTIVVLCVITIPVYLFAPFLDIMEIVLLIRFIVRALRIITVIRSQKFRKEYISATDTIVDFTKFNEQRNINKAANNTNEQFLWLMRCNLIIYPLPQSPIAMSLSYINIETLFATKNWAWNREQTWKGDPAHLLYWVSFRVFSHRYTLCSQNWHSAVAFWNLYAIRAMYSNCLRDVNDVVPGSYS